MLRIRVCVKFIIRTHYLDRVISPMCVLCEVVDWRTENQAAMLVLDPSRNFFHYRNLLTAEGPHAPLIPYLPLVLKDLTFIHLGNPSRYADNLVNFAKLRMIAKEVCFDALSKAVPSFFIVGLCACCYFY
ncbi:unnamed protein product [Schistocephalus solidus]|uniref:Ras-GEF domain-containing protein n=1 Tax=Schistocephalus solidus TaxID=70667 RepID=A0A183T9E4_SCHSO|nr:unnamed protein product [Schistocephalus solidus]